MLGIIGRRELIVALGGVAVTWPLGLQAQQPSKIAKIGFLGLNPASSFTTRIEALWKGLHQLGYVEGKNLLIEYQWADTVDQLPELAAQLVRMKVDLIFAPVSTFVEPARQVTKTIPIVFASHADPVGVGHVQSLAHPGGNVTGLSMLNTELAAKELEILHEAIPQSTRIGILWNPTTPSHGPAMQSVQDAAASLGVRLYPAPTRRVEDFESAFASILGANVDSLLVLASPMSYSDRGMLLAQLALKYQTRPEVRKLTQLRHRLIAVGGRLCAISCSSPGRKIDRIVQGVVLGEGTCSGVSSLHLLAVRQRGRLRRTRSSRRCR